MNDVIGNRCAEDPAIFHARFWRFHRLLHFIACRVLGGPERADHAIENCWLRASRNPPRFEYEGAFRSWLVRVLIDQALVLLRDNEGSGQRDQILAEGAALAEAGKLRPLLNDRHFSIGD
jgi:DNA-directed RNA polymerase specialized sigma24 family protein